MKFDYAIGNPPYQGESQNNGRKPPVYHYFLEEAYKIADVAELIHPARFLFDAGQTPKVWNRKMLDDTHFKVLYYEPDAAKVFQNTEIKGGVAITIRDIRKDYGATEVFTSHQELNGIIKKVIKKNGGDLFLDSIISSRGTYRTTELFAKDYPYASKRLGKGTGNMIASNFFEKLPECYVKDEPQTNRNEFLGIMARLNNSRTICYIKKAYVQTNEFIDGYNLASPKSNGNGIFGEILTSTEILKPGIGATDTFISIGSFKTVVEAENIQKYLKTKFFRALLGVKKVTQDNPKSVWNMIPLQDFTSNSDISWSASIHDIDQQFYKKYGLSQQEIDFIESHVKEME